MKYLVLGASGMAGHLISLYLYEHGNEVDGICRKNGILPNTIICDVRNQNELSSIIKRGKYDAIINAVGLLNNACEENKQDAVYLNSFLPHFLSHCVENTDTQVIQMSTDCIFSGATGPYYLDSFPDGKSFYARTKALGELSDDKNLTIRTSIVGPDLNVDGIGLLNWFMKQKEVNGYTHAMWTGVTTLELAKAIEVATKDKVNGIVQLVGQSNISKCNLVKLFNHYLKNDSVIIHDYDNYVTDKTLIRGSDKLNFNVSSYDDMINEMAQWIHDHKELYKYEF